MESNKGLKAIKNLRHNGKDVVFKEIADELLYYLQDCRQHIYSVNYDKAILYYGGEGSNGASEIAERSALMTVRDIDIAINKALNN